MSGAARWSMTATGIPATWPIRAPPANHRPSAEKLYERSHKGAYERLILVADPETLGEIRPLLHQEVSDKIVLEQAKTLINSPVADIEKSLAQ